MLKACKASSISKPSDTGTTTAPVQPECLGTSGNHERTEQTQKVWAKVCNYRKARLQFHATRAQKGGDILSLTDIYKPAGVLTKLFNASKSKMWGSTASQSNLTKAFVICADTLAVQEQSSRRPQLSHTDEMSHLLKWLTPHKDNQTMVSLCDGHKQAELWVTYAGLTAEDPREPKRRV